MSNQMIDYLERFNEQAEERYQRSVDQMKLADGITEELKAKDQMEWVRRMNMIAISARDLVLYEMVYQSMMKSGCCPDSGSSRKPYSAT